MTGDTKKAIKLYCPSVSKIVQWEACDFEQKIDLGSIAGAFGLEPQSLRLNGHFISRGADLIASSVTWNSLLSFFSSRAFSTDPIIVHGKLSRVGAKRSGMHDPENIDIGAMNIKGCGFHCLDGRLQAVDGVLFNAKRLKGEDKRITSSLKRKSLPVPKDQNELKRKRFIGGEDDQINSSRKRKSLTPDQISLKRTRTSGTNSVDFKRNVDLSNNANGSSELSCSSRSLNMKQAREDEMLLAGPSKRLR